MLTTSCNSILSSQARCTLWSSVISDILLPGCPAVIRAGTELFKPCFFLKKTYSNTLISKNYDLGFEGYYNPCVYNNGRTVFFDDLGITARPWFCKIIIWTCNILYSTSKCVLNSAIVLSASIFDTDNHYFLWSKQVTSACKSHLS